MGRNAVPAAVSDNFAPDLSKRVSPRSFSKVRSCRDKDGWATIKERDAALIDPSSTMLRKYARCLKSTMPPRY
jgi:hypothetical protein